ncbi:hypothetical protein ONS95_006995 [Cadophora gregata]|uniref:uncharacterized protein n=1 Tax=Cadophora gregata TaxID=51156 RepID=UPI0026DACC5B|nr:uncharacterized protein ONS95_006995 [Cadophora gregata]KAK0100535.1 hypothetical protein ONS95_006995 [Cadophora gregata]
MAARPGEDLAATLFADIHYYYGPPGAKPPHHRFDKGSYVYLFENASQRRARIEIANNAGTAEQDAFTGHLDAAHVQYSYKHSTLVTLTVDGTPNQRNSPIDGQDWHLPTFDPHNENKYMYKLHTLDIYFWTKEDAVLLMNGIRRVLPQHQITVQDEPITPPPHPEDMSPVVQKLENVAITDPSYQQGRTRDSRTTTSSAGGAPSFPGPPISATPQSQEASSFAPLAYNPAAPAAPEAIRHREKTPPPEDGAANPLVAAAASDREQIFGAPPYGQQGFSGPPQQRIQQQQQQSYFSHPPPPASAPPASVQPPAQYPNQSPQNVQSPYAQHFQNSFAPPPTAPTGSSPYAQQPQVVSPPVSAPPPPAYQQQQQHQQPQQHPQQQANIPVTQYAAYPLSPGLSPSLSTPGIYSPGPNPLSPGISGPPPPQPHVAPPGGFSQHQYSNSGNTKPLMTDYSIHQQVYRPTENEAYKPKKEAKPPRGNLEKRAGQLEKGLGSMFKKIEKKIG